MDMACLIGRDAHTPQIGLLSVGSPENLGCDVHRRSCSIFQNVML